MHVSQNVRQPSVKTTSVKTTAVWLLFVVVCDAMVSAQQAPSESVQVEFGSQIQPILFRRCHKCHGQDNQEGNLRLDEKEYVDRGGHTGNSILGNGADDSELLRRITATDLSYRMPKDGQPLSAQEIALFRRWIEQGALWTTSDPMALAQQARTGETWFELFLRIEQYIKPVETFYLRVRRIVIPFILFLLFVLMSERAKVLRSRQHRWSSGRAAFLFSMLSRLRPSHHLAVLLLFVIAVLWLYDRAELDETRASVKSLQDKITQLTTPTQSIGEKTDGVRGPIPFRPKHPKRLGGEYYRGNDERNPKLFNGGYYRTANFRVHLCDAGRRQLAWGDQVTDCPLYVCLEIEKASNATPYLFTEAITRSTYLSRQVVGQHETELEDIPVTLETIVESEHWAAYYPIGDPSESEAGLSGMIYVYKGTLTDNQVNGQVHYGIQYDIKVHDGRIDADSEIWMGSLFQLGNLLIPPAGTIPLHEWFDFQPIPEITGENTDDPKLLGIDEHAVETESSKQSDGEETPQEPESRDEVSEHDDEDATP